MEISGELWFRLQLFPYNQLFKYKYFFSAFGQLAGIFPLASYNQ